LPDSKLPLAGDVSVDVEALLAGDRVEAVAELVSNENSPAGVGFRTFAVVRAEGVAVGVSVGRADANRARCAGRLADALGMLPRVLAWVAFRFVGLTSRVIAGFGSGSNEVATQ
jgi:hypothetical protein